MLALHRLHSSVVDILDREHPAATSPVDDEAGGRAREEDEGWTRQSSLRRAAGRT